MAPKGKIVEVWGHNLVEEIAKIAEVLEEYPYVAIDTEFPGVVAEPVGHYKNQIEQRYQTLRVNVDMLKIIQIGFSFADEAGNLSPDVSTWQFNFKFSLESDTYAQDSINLLTGSGIDFERFRREGIDVEDFGEKLISSGVVLNDNVKWISFHSCYDFAYLLKAVTSQSMPEDRDGFLDVVKMFFPNIYDMKYIAQEKFRGGLNKLAAHYKVERNGQMHQAGSDSLVTELTFFKLRDDYGKYIEEVFNGKLFGIEDVPDGSLSPPRTQQESDSPQRMESKESIVVNAPSPAVLPDSVVLPMHSFSGSYEQMDGSEAFGREMNVQEYVY